jgi:eukaryotic-like serine/threonine-protein kinase
MSEQLSPTLAPAATGPVSSRPSSSAHLPEDPRVTQALEEYLAALEAGTCPDRQQFQARYPDIADELGDYLEGLEFLHRTAAQIQASSCGPSVGRSRVPADEYVPTLEDYKILREIGRGGMGIVYEAEQRSLHRRVALKVLPLGATLDPRHLQRFKNEAQAVAQLQHPNIVPVFAVGCEQGVHYYAMRFIEGKTLRELIRESRRSEDPRAGATQCRGSRTDSTRIDNRQSTEDGSVRNPQPEIRNPKSGESRAPRPERTEVKGANVFRQVAWIGVQAAEALEHAHQMGVIHRDVKPANLILDDQGQLWITDFGLARWTTDVALTITGDMLGTLPYMSPEQASARRGLVDHRTDVYSLGATLYELVTLLPVCRGDQRDLLNQLLHEDPVPPRRLCPDMPRDLETIVLKALGKQVEERYPTAQDMADDLRRFLEGRPVLARRPGVWDRIGKWSRRHLPVVISAAVLLVLSVMGLTACTFLIGLEQAKTKAAYEKESLARQTEAEAREKEAEARAHAERNFHDTRRLLDDIAEIAAVEMEADTDIPTIRRKLLQSALGYYEDFLRHHHDNKLTHEELLRGHTRVATILEAIGRPKDAQVVLDQAINIYLTTEDGETAFHLMPANRKLRLLTLANVQKELNLVPKQVRSIIELETRRNKPVHAETGGAGHAPHELREAIEQEAVDLLNTDQARRLKQLLLQQAGLWAFQDEVLAALRREARAIQQKSEKFGERDRKAFVDRFVAQLTAEQRGQWAELVGEPFQGALPPGELILNVGRMVLQMAPGDFAQKRGDRARPNGQHP